MHRYAQIRGGTPAHNMENEAAPGCSRLLLAAPGCPGCFWLLLAAAGCSLLPRESKSSPGGPNRAPGVQIKPWRSKSSPWRSKSSPGSQNGSSRLQADKKHHSGRVPGAGSKSSPRGPNQAPGIQIKPWRSKSSPRGPNQALEVQIKPLEVQIKPWVTKRVFKAAGR